VLVGPKRTSSIDSFFHSLRDGFHILTSSTGEAVPKTNALAGSLGKWKTVTETVVTETGRLGKETDVTTSKVHVFAGTTQSVIAGLKAQAHQLNVVAAQYENALGPLGNYIGATITEKQDLVTLNADLKKSHDVIGLKTAAERASFTDTQTYINQTIATGNAALKTNHGIQGQIDVIEKALPRLEAVKGKTADYKHELDLLKGILDKLRAEKLIQENIRVSGTGSWSFSRTKCSFTSSACQTRKISPCLIEQGMGRTSRTLSAPSRGEGRDGFVFMVNLSLANQAFGAAVMASYNPALLYAAQ